MDERMHTGDALLEGCEQAIRYAAELVNRELPLLSPHAPEGSRLEREAWRATAFDRALAVLLPERKR